MFVISVNPGNLIQREVQANMNSGGKVELDMHAPPTIRKMWIPAGAFFSPFSHSESVLRRLQFSYLTIWPTPTGLGAFPLHEMALCKLSLRMPC